MQPLITVLTENTPCSISAMLFRQGFDATLDFFCTLFVFSLD